MQSRLCQPLHHLCSLLSLALFRPPARVAFHINAKGAVSSSPLSIRALPLPPHAALFVS